MNYQCQECEGTISIKVNEARRWVSLKCRCKMVIIYFDGVIKVKPKDEYIPHYKEGEHHV
jgi:hypothetical protein